MFYTNSTVASTSSSKNALENNNRDQCQQNLKISDCINKWREIMQTSDELEPQYRDRLRNLMIFETLSYMNRHGYL